MGENGEKTSLLSFNLVAICFQNYGKQQFEWSIILSKQRQDTGCTWVCQWTFLNFGKMSVDLNE